MEVICLLLVFLSLTTARVYPRTGANDVFDGVEGVVYDIPEYEDPEVSLFKLIARGIMPVYTTGDAVKDSKDSSNEDDKPHYQTDDIKKGLDTVIVQLQEAKNKLENGNNGIYLDIDKSVLFLENLKHHLYLDLHKADGSAKQSSISAILSKKSPIKVSTHVYPILRATIKKYLTSDDSMYKYYSLETSSEKPFDKSADSFFSFDTALVPYSVKNSSVEQSSIDDHSDEQSFESNASQDLNLPSDAVQLFTLDSTSEQSSGLDKEAFKYHLLGTEVPPIEATPDEKKVKPFVVSDVISSAEAEKDEKPDKTVIRKKFTWKLSSTI